MKSTYIASLALIVAGFTSIEAQQFTGDPFIHDPATIAFCDGKYYTFGTGENGIMSADGWHWETGAIRPGRGAAPDVLKIGDRYLVAYSSTGGGLGGTHSGKILTMWTKTLDPKSPDFGYTQAMPVAESLDDEDCDAIDAGLFLDPKDGRLWVTYGTYFGFIRIVELDPETGLRVEGNEAVNIAIDCEATDLIYKDGWYYLLGTHGTCCDGANSTYNIVVGRSRKVTGPYVDNMGRDMLQGGGKMVLAAHDKVYGPGHFGRYIEEPGVEKMSCHYEADMDRGGYSVLGIVPLLWQNGWPVGGQNLKDGTYEIESVRRGYALELSVDFTRVKREFRAFWNIDKTQLKPIAMPTLADVEADWKSAEDAEGKIAVRIGDYMMRPNQKWTITAAEGAGGYLGAPYYKIIIEGTQRALAATANGELTTVSNFSGADEQLWRIEQLTDGSYRIMPKSVPGREGAFCLTSSGDSTPTLAPFDFKSDNCKWNLKL
ncbi:MAG: family 43 glycosylhydrolase [Marinilabiliaceae bacterium]|nr:family 43 glycosylhydrolase [Marinilabiliaceae bacterium]